MIRKFFKFFAIILIFIGVLITAYTYFMHESAEEDMNSLLYEKSETSSLEQEYNPVLGIAADMDVKEVKTLKDCITIPSCKIKAPLVEGVLMEKLRLGVGHFPKTAKMGELGNCCYAGHYSTIYNCVFNGIEKIRLWDEINLYNKNGKCFKYYVTDTYVTEPDDMSVLNKTKSERRLTLVTCAEQGRKRFIIVAINTSDKEIALMKKQERLQNIKSLTILAKRQGTLNITEYLSKKRGR